VVYAPSAGIAYAAADAGNLPVSLVVKAAFHDTDTDILASVLARKSRVSDVRM